MKDIKYEAFYDPTEEFNKKEVRACCYDISQKLIKEAKIQDHQNWYTHEKTIDAIIILLFCWNFASRITKSLKRNQIKDLLVEVEQFLRKLEGKTITNFDEKDEGEITTVYKKFTEVMGQTGASKALSLMNCDLFVMWDTGIRKILRKKLIKGIGNGEKAEHYLKFLKGINQIIKKYNLENKVNGYPPLAKKIDEYHYICMKL